ncbi:MAG: hypothetical protein ACPGVH_06320, partial [Chitinophagales bacterium]
MKWFLVYIVFSSLFLVSCLENRTELNEIIIEDKPIRYIENGSITYTKYDTSKLRLDFRAHRGKLSCFINFDDRNFENQLIELTELMDSAKLDFNLDSLNGFRFSFFYKDSNLSYLI